MVSWLFTDPRVIPFGQRLYITGNTLSLGNWQSFIAMNWYKGVWMVTIDLDEFCPVEYKYVVSEYEGVKGWCRWD
jgi:hypothetical protein